MKRAFIFHICRNKKLDKGSLKFLLTWVLLGHGSENLQLAIPPLSSSLCPTLQPAAQQDNLIFPTWTLLACSSFSSSEHASFPVLSLKILPRLQGPTQVLCHSLFYNASPRSLAEWVSAPEQCGSALTLSTCFFVLCLFTCSFFISLQDCQLLEVRTSTATVPVIYSAVLCT